MDWNSVHRNWDKWASSNAGSSGQPLKAALLINYDPTGPSRLLSTMNAPFILADHNGKCDIHFGTEGVLVAVRGFLIFCFGSAEQEGIEADPVEVGQLVNFIKRNKLQTESFFVGPNQYIVTTIHENWFAARCMNTSKPSGEGAIVMQTPSFILVTLYEGSIGSASRAMLAADQFAWQLTRRNH